MNSDEKITLETLPGAVMLMAADLREIKSLMHVMTDAIPKESDRWLNLNEFRDYHPDKPTKATVYSWVSAGSVPHHKTSKRLRFLKSEIDIWLKEGKRKTVREIQAEADSYLHNKSKRGKQ